MRNVAILLPLAVAGCGNVGFDAVSVRPIYGWVDGCNQVKVAGHGFGDDLTIKLSGPTFAYNAEGEYAATAEADRETIEVTEWTAPDPNSGERLDALNAGFMVWATMPQSSGPGVYDLIVGSGGEEDIVPNAYYFEACYGGGAPYVEAIIPSEGLAGGTSMAMVGCGIDADAFDLRIDFAFAGVDEAGNVLGAPLESASDAGDITSVCRTAEATVSAPEMADGTYIASFYEAGTSNAAVPGCWEAADTGDTGGGDTGGGETVWHCDPSLILTYGGGE